MVRQADRRAGTAGEVGQLEVAAALEQRLARGIDDAGAAQLRAFRWLCHFVPKVNSIQYRTRKTALSTNVV